MDLVKFHASSRGAHISVCLLVYNDVASLAETVQTILAQTLPEFEFIISDDCSKDGTWEAVLELAKKHPNIRAIQTPRNLKMCGNANYAASHATRDYIALLHHGDIYREDLLEKWLDIMERYSTVGFVFNAVADRTANGIVLSDLSKNQNFSEKMIGRHFLENVLLKKWGCPVWGTTMIRRSCWETLGGMCEEFEYLADVDLWMRIAARWDVGYVDDTIFAIQDGSERPDDYPADYKPSSFWPRKKLIYSIHASNLAQYYAKAGWRRWWKWLTFRIRVSMENSRWLTYTVVRKKNDMLLDSVKAECPWEFFPVRWYRNGLIWAKRLGIV